MLDILSDKNKSILKKLDRDKIKINWNKNPILMSDFLSFLTIDVEIGTGHGGYDNGWTRRYGEDGLVVRGGIVRGVEYLDMLEYKKGLSDPYSNFCNPFFLLDILSKEGVSFFLNYYKDDIESLIDEANRKYLSAREHASDVALLFEGVTSLT